MMLSLIPLLEEYSRKTGLIFDASVKGDNVYLEKHCIGPANCSTLLRYYGRKNSLYGSSVLEMSAVDTWLSIVEQLSTVDNPDSLLGYANAQTATVTYLAGHSLSIADFAFWNYIQFHNVNLDRYTHLKRWYSFISSTINISSVLPKSSLNPQTGSPKKKVKQDDVGKFVDLPAAEMGKVVVRFPPEASGYLHIGHAKAALVNQYYQQLFQGKLILRFDDTNPAKENEHFENVIRKDLEMLEVKYDVETRSSDHFETLIKYCEQMIREGNAYADDTEGETMKQEREARIESKNRNNSVEKNLEIWNEMLIGSEKGQQYCIRAKIDMNSNNGCMRDPTLYRCKTESHVSTGDKFKAYPTYDFTCPIVDSIEGVTHALRTTEYNDRNEQYGWILDKLKLRKPHIWEYARLNLQNTVLSKRKLTWLVNEGVVDSWEDPRFPTVRGILRHGMTVQGLKDFIAAQGGSRSVVQMEWDKIWSFNKKVIDPVAPRYTALSQESLVPVELEGFDVEDMKEHQLHPKNKEVGMKQVAYSKTILIEQADALLLNEGESVTLINWGNCVINKLHRSADAKLIVGIDAKLNLSDTNFKSTKHKLTWLPEKHSKAQSVPITARYYDHLISKPVLGKDEDMKDFVNWNSLKEESLIGDHNMSKIKERDIIQIQRKGFFICDRAYQPFQPSLGRDLPAIFIFIPDGHKTQEEQVKQVAQTSKQKQNSPKKTKTTEPTTGDTGKGLDLDKVKKLTGDISAQGDLVRKLKSEKKPAEEIKSAVEQLLALKNDFKSATGVDYTPQAAEKLIASAPDPISNSSAVSSDNLDEQVAAQGEKVRALKAQKAPKEEIDSAVQELLALKAQFKQVSGNDWKPKTTPDSNSGASKSSSAAKEDKENAKGAKKSEKKKDKSQKEGERKGGAGGGNDGEGDGQKKKETKLGLGITMEENYSEWYTQVITKAEMIEYYDVSGCYVLRPLAYAIWEMIQKFFDAEIKKLDVENVYFPMFVSKAALEREKDHIADFAPEVAWVTRSGKSELAEPIAIRPTSETVMYPSYAKWIQSHRDLPLKLNQWNNVVRWEFKHPTPFLRTREFLWQEGHTAFATREEAVDEVHTILHLYSRVFQELLAIPVVKGRKTEKEKFPGADFTTTCEAFIFQCGRGIQGATSHHLGQNFSKMFNIVFENPDNPGEQLCVHQNCWGLSTRTIGTMVMMHSDNRGLVIPPRVAHFKAVVVPCGITDQVNEKQLHDHCSELTREFNESGLKAKADLRPNYSPGWKFNHWELKGVPVRVEIGPKDLQKEQVTLVRRDTGERSFAKRGDVISAVRDLLEKIHESLFEKAKNNLNTHMIVTKSFDEFCTLLDQKNILLAPFCGEKDCEGVIKEESAKGRDVDANAPSMGAKSLCIPFDQPKEDITKCKCINPTCKKAPKMFTLFGRSY